MKKNRLWTLAVLFYVLFIYSNSMKPAVLSSQDSGFVLGLAQDIFEYTGSEASWLTEHAVRKLAHFSEYAVLGILLSGCFRSYGLKADRQWLLHGLAGFILPFVDETIQLFVEGRSGQLSDVWLDCSGVFFGTAVFLVFLLIGKRMESMNVKKLPDHSSV